MKNVAEFYVASAPLVRAFSKFVFDYYVSGNAKADHICFKCSSSEEFEHLRALLEPESEYVYQSYISGRRIAVIRIKSAFDTPLGQIKVVELSDQKPDGSQTSGFDHIEIYPDSITYEALVAIMEKTNLPLKKVERPHHTTVDIPLDGGYLVRLTREPLLDKIKREMR